MPEPVKSIGTLLDEAKCSQKDCRRRDTKELNWCQSFKVLWETPWSCRCRWKGNAQEPIQSNSTACPWRQPGKEHRQLRRHKIKQHKRQANRAALTLNVSVSRIISDFVMSRLSKSRTYFFPDLPLFSLVQAHWFSGRTMLTFSSHLISSQSLNLGGRRGTTDDVATISFHPSLSSAGPQGIFKPDSRPFLDVIFPSLLLSSSPSCSFHCPLQNCLRHARGSWDVAIPSEFPFFTMLRRSACTPVAFWILLRTSSFVTFSL